MKVVVVCSHPRDCVESVLAARPARLDEGLRRLLADGGHAVEQVVLPAVQGWAGDDGQRATQLLLRRQEAAGADVVHALDALSGVTALRARAWTGTPTVVRAQPAHGALVPPDDRARWLACLHAADGLTLPTASDVREARQLGVPRERLHLVTAVAAGEVPATSALSRPSGEKLVSVLSGPHAWGGTPDVVRALTRLRGVRLVVAGRGPSPSAASGLLAAAEALGVADRVRVVGWLSEDDTVRLVERSALVVAPRRGLTSGGASLRAMGLGRPVVAVHGPVQVEIVVDGETGILVPPRSPRSLADAMAELMGDPFLREAMGQAGQDRAFARFGPEVTLRALEAAYHHAAAHTAHTAFPPAAPLSAGQAGFGSAEAV